MHLLGRALSTLTHLNGNAILADEEGIHWRVVHESAALIRYLAKHSPHSQGNFNFTATAMLKPYGPFFPGTYYTGDADAVSIGYPGPVVDHRPTAEPHNLGSGWMGFDFAAAFKRPAKVINDAAMQALGSYQGGRMLFLGLGTGLGSAMIVESAPASL